MKKISCIIVDDEPIAVRIIRNHLKHFEEFELVGTSTNAMDAMKLLRSNTVALIFLDIEMPGLNGMEMLKGLSQSPAVIFTTAHRDYAVDAFTLNAVDYLLKPVSLERFTLAVNKFLDLQLQQNEQKLTKTVEALQLRVDKKNRKISFDDILYVESLADYVLVITKTEKLITHERISHLEEKLPENFLRVHRGYIVDINKVTAWYGNTLEIDSLKIPIGRNYREEVLKRL